VPSQSTSRFTHVCIDCGALGVAGGYHDHGDGNAGDTMPLASLPVVLRSFQKIENERDELRAEVERLAREWRDTDERWQIAKAEVQRLRQGLWDCAIATGMDHDGDLTPEHLAHPDIVELALREVREMRADYEEELGGGRA
jgi:hypothetical protein